jgi:DHA2 family multidrug resistance protein
MMALFGLGLFGVIAMQPLMLERLFDYPAETTGLIMAPRGVASAFGMFVVSRLIQRVRVPLLILCGLVFAAAGTYFMTWYSLYVNPVWLVWPSVLQGLGMGMIFVPLSTIAYQTLPAGATDQGSAIFNLARTIGSAMGISIAATVLTHMTQTNWNRLGGHLNPYNPVLQHWLAVHGMAPGDPQAYRLLADALGRQAGMLGFIDVYWFITCSYIFLAFLLFMLRQRKPAVAGVAVRSERMAGSER